MDETIFSSKSNCWKYEWVPFSLGAGIPNPEIIIRAAEKNEYLRTSGRWNFILYIATSSLFVCPLAFCRYADAALIRSNFPRSLFSIFAKFYCQPDNARRQNKKTGKRGKLKRHVHVSRLSTYLYLHAPPHSITNLFITFLFFYNNNQCSNTVYVCHISAKLIQFVITRVSYKVINQLFFISDLNKPMRGSLSSRRSNTLFLLVMSSTKRG